MAAAPALGCTGEEMRQSVDLAEPHPIAAAVRNLLEQRSHFTGSATQLFELLQPVVGCQTPKGVSQHLRSSVLTLADIGIVLKFRRLHEGAGIIEISHNQGGASYEKPPQDASPNLAPQSQPTEKEPLTVR
jgi:hypothetical protein